MSGQTRRVLRTTLVLVSLGFVNMAAQGGAGQPQLIVAESVEGTGDYSNSASLIIDGRMPAQGADWNNPQCVYWEGGQVRFVIALEGVHRITGLTLQADNNDDYIIESSMDGRVFSPLLVVKGEWGEVLTGMETLSTLRDDPHFIPEMAISPLQAKYLRLSGRGGDNAFGVSELLIYGNTVPSPRPVSTPGGEPQLIVAESIKGTGRYTNAASLIINGRKPPEGADWNAPQCVYWEGTQTRFVITLDGVYRIAGLTLQADNNDDYVIEASMDGRVFSPLVVVKGEWGEVFTGMETHSTLRSDSHFLPEMAIKPVQAKYLRLSGRGGDDAYSVSELLVYGNKVRSLGSRWP